MEAVNEFVEQAKADHKRGLLTDSQLKDVTDMFNPEVLE